MTRGRGPCGFEIEPPIAIRGTVAPHERDVAREPEARRSRRTARNVEHAEEARLLRRACELIEALADGPPIALLDRQNPLAVDAQSPTFLLE